MIKKVILLLLISVSAHAATYYISPTGNNDTGNGSTGTPWATLSKAFTSMSGGDTLIVKDGTYTGADNCITADQRPPSGSAGAWTIIKAEHDGEAVFDGQNTTAMVNCGYIGNNDIHDPRDAYSHPLYYQFEGILWAKQGGTSPQFQRCRFVKFLRCGTYDAADGNNANFSANRCADFLFENCYSYGSGRYKFIVYCSTRTVLRHCVARMDHCNPNEVIALFSMYSAVNCEVQNCIAIDSDQNDFYTNVYDRAGSFCVPSTDADADQVNFTNCVAVNNSFGGMMVAGNNFYSRNVTFKNCALIDLYNTAGYPLHNFKGMDSLVQNCTLIGGSLGTTGRGFTGDGGIRTTMKNNIISDYVAQFVLISINTENYNNVYNSTGTSSVAGGVGIWAWSNGSGTWGYKGANTRQLNPVWKSSTNPNGAIKYPVRVETGSNLSGQGENGADIGANCTKMIGVPGTMWGESGYNTEQSTNMWPFPNETLIRNKMKAYSGGGVSGNRGFCADGTTLTKYIWEYLGNPIPAEIYGKSEPVRRRLSISGGITISGSVQLK